MKHRKSKQNLKLDLVYCNLGGGELFKIEWTTTMKVQDYT